MFQRGVAEFVGTFALVFVGVGSIAATQGRNLTAIALAHGLVIAVMASAVGHISGGHSIPPSPLGSSSPAGSRSTSRRHTGFAQLTAGLLAALLLRAVLPEGQADAVDLGAPTLGSGVSGWKAS
jgi:glycerol uptake facilitator-like aquaporin